MGPRQQLRQVTSEVEVCKPNRELVSCRTCARGALSEVRMRWKRVSSRFPCPFCLWEAFPFPLGETKWDRVKPGETKCVQVRRSETPRTPPTSYPALAGFIGIHVENSLNRMFLLHLVFAVSRGVIPALSISAFFLCLCEFSTLPFNTAIVQIHAFA